MADSFARLSGEEDQADVQSMPEGLGRGRSARKWGMLGFLAVGFVAAVYATRSTGGAVTTLVSGRTTNLIEADEAPGPAMVHFSQIDKMSIPAMPGSQGSKSYIMDISLSEVPNKEMAAGLYRLDAGPKLDYTYTYEEFKLIIDGEFHLEDGTGQKVIAKKGDLMYFPRGTRVIFTTPNTATGYFIGQRISPESGVKVDAAVRADMASNPAMKHFPQIASNLSQIPLLPGAHGSKSYLMDMAFSNKTGKEMTAGLYHELAGPTLHYTYTYEEIKYIWAGEFRLTDGTGQKVIAKAGDLMYFPKGTKMRFDTPQFALGFFCGQRKGGAA